MDRRTFLASAALAAPVMATCQLRAAGTAALPQGRPEDLGFSTARLERIRAATFPAPYVLLVARRGRMLFYHADGHAKQAIFPIASMTKAIVSAAAMTLAEEGKLHLDQPVSRYLPEFSDVKVGVAQEKPKRPPTVQDLLRHTSGLTYGIFGNSEVDKLYVQARLFASSSLAEFVRSVAKLPLKHQPGEVWEYSVSTDVLGRVIEVITEKTIDAALDERVLKPLGMTDTAFFLSQSRLGRYARTDPGAKPAMDPDPAKQPPLLMPGAGLYSTAMDYARFCQCLLNGGKLGESRILSPKTVQLMTADHLTPEIRRSTTISPFSPVPEYGMSWGLGFAVRTHMGRNSLPGSVGDYSWSGINGTYFWVDPKEELLAVLMTKVPRAQIAEPWRMARELVYQALTESYEK